MSGLDGKKGAELREALIQFGKNIKSDVSRTAPFNKNVNGRIVEITGDGYTVEIQTRKYPNVKAINAQNLQVNDIVACCIPNNQMSQVYILGKLVGNISVSASGGTMTDMQVNGVSVVNNGVGNIVTKGTYNASTNKIVTESDLPTVNDGTLTIKKNNSTEATFTANQSGNTDVNFATVAFSGSYADLSNKPTIPTVNDGQLTINQNGTQLGTFTANQSGNTTVDITNSNPNLLINSNFLINQRGYSSYNAPGSGVKYCVDRHYQSSASISIIISPQNSGIDFNGGIHIHKNVATVSGFYMISQRLEGYKQLAGKTLTLSVAYRNNTGKFRLQANDGVSSYNSSAISDTSGLATLTFTMDESPTNLRCTIQDQQTASMDIDIDYWKLEVGNIATAYTPPYTAEELPKCYRYYQRIITPNGYGIFCNAYAASTTTARFTLPLLATMRTAPTIGYNGTISYYQYDNYIQTVCNITAMSLTTTLTNGIMIQGTISGGTANTLGFVRANNSADAYIELDAEI